MHYTNVFYSKKSVDLYTYIIEKLEIIYKDNLFISFYKNRNIVKETCMLYLYGSQPLKIAKKIILLYNITNILLIDLINICNNILKLFKSEFAILEKIKKLVYYYINILPIDLDIHFNIDGKSLKYNCPLKKDINFKLYSEKHKKNSNCYVSAKLETTKASYENKRKYALVNLVHSIDSNACVNIRYNLYKKGITTQYVQDCFICVLENYEKVLNEYNKQLLRFFNISFLDILLELKDITFYNKI
jgi:hypothetical protein